MICPKCGYHIVDGAVECPYCKTPLTEKGDTVPPPPQPQRWQNSQQKPYAPPVQGYYVYPVQPTRRMNNNAVISLVLGVSSFMGLIMCSIVGIALGIIAILLGIKAKKEIEMDPSQDGMEMATVGIITGVLSLILSILLFLFFLMSFLFLLPSITAIIP